MDVIKAVTSGLVLVDFQARLMPVIHESEGIVATAALLGGAARLLGIPVIGTEHNPNRLGPNIEQISTCCGRTVGKTHFDACADGLLGALDEAGIGGNQIVVAGCEAHVCLLQTALGLLRADKQVWVVTNASGSRRPSDHSAAMARLAQAGATIVTHEMVMFEWIEDCRHPRFREVLALIKAR